MAPRASCSLCFNIHSLGPLGEVAVFILRLWCYHCTKHTIPFPCGKRRKGARCLPRGRGNETSRPLRSRQGKTGCRLVALKLRFHRLRQRGRACGGAGQGARGCRMRGERGSSHPSEGPLPRDRPARLILRRWREMCARRAPRSRPAELPAPGPAGPKHTAPGDAGQMPWVREHPASPLQGVRG